MKLAIKLYFLGVAINTVSCGFLSDLVTKPLDTIVGSVMGLGLDVANAGCIVLGDTVEGNPIKEATEDDISFILITPCGRQEFPFNSVDQLRQAPGFNGNRTSVFFITGWLVNPDKEYINDMAKAFNCRGDYNFVLVNTNGVINNLYFSSAYHTGELGRLIAMALQNTAIHSAKIYVIGHSLGAQIAGSAGRYYEQLTGNKLPRITALDPARPCFVFTPVYPRVGKGDASFVDIIHTNPSGLGLEEAVGDADFFPGGLDSMKPGCNPLELLCSHERAIFFYAESVNHEMNFMARQCIGSNDLENKSCWGPSTPMGFAANPLMKGVFYTEIRDASPYGLNAVGDSSLGNCGSCPQ
ncbi:phospholipase A1-like [Haematobia irritans]|uniref:phospholipase A1-like n=1 Tax=Haematobia irritans TaxID=7368 RepID=UPI003F50BF74